MNTADFFSIMHGFKIVDVRLCSFIKSLMSSFLTLKCFFFFSVILKFIKDEACYNTYVAMHSIYILRSSHLAYVYIQ